MQDVFSLVMKLSNFTCTKQLFLSLLFFSSFSPIQFEMETNLNILDLPDDCLILTYKKLCFPDLLSIHKSCKYFHNAVESTFLINHKVMDITCWNYSDTYSIRTTYDCSNAIVNLNDMAKIFRIFGRWITSLTISGANEHFFGTDVSQILCLLNEYSKGKLKCLSLENVTLNADRIDNFADLLRQLEMIRVKNIFSSLALEKCINYCENLKDLVIIADKKIEYSFLLSPPKSKLERIVYQCISNNMETDDIIQLVQRCPNLNTVRISGTFIPASDNLKYLKNVQTLSIDLRNAPDLEQLDWTGLFQLDKLKRLEIDLGENVSETLLSKVTPKPSTDLQTLVLRVSCFNDVINFLKTFTYHKLTTLILNCDRVIEVPDVQPNVIKTFAKNLNQLNEVHFIHLPMDGFNYVLQLLENAQYLSSLTLSTKVYEKFSTVDLLRLIDVQRSRSTHLTVNFDYKTFAETQEIVQNSFADFLHKHSNIIKICGIKDFNDYFDDGQLF